MTIFTKHNIKKTFFSSYKIGCFHFVVKEGVASTHLLLIRVIKLIFAYPLVGSTSTDDFLFLLLGVQTGDKVEKK